LHQGQPTQEGGLIAESRREEIEPFTEDRVHQRGERGALHVFEERAAGASYAASQDDAFRVEGVDETGQRRAEGMRRGLKDRECDRIAGTGGGGDFFGGGLAGRGGVSQSALVAHLAGDGRARGECLQMSELAARTARPIELNRDMSPTVVERCGWGRA